MVLVAGCDLGADSATSTLGETLGIESVQADELYEVAGRLGGVSRAHRTRAKRHFHDGTLVLYDVTWSNLEGRCCPPGHIGCRF